jgi:carbonic anhydrase/acetyltransferase-like protein (isoleucine patch superfamily)
MGTPGKIIRQLDEKEILAIKENAERYINNWKNYKKNFK